MPSISAIRSHAAAQAAADVAEAGWACAFRQVSLLCEKFDAISPEHAEQARALARTIEGDMHKLATLIRAMNAAL